MKLLHVSQLVRITCAEIAAAAASATFGCRGGTPIFFSGGGGAAGCKLAAAAEFGG